MLDTLLRHLPMVRLSVGAFAALALIGCTGLIEGGEESLTPEEQAARRLYIGKAKPVLDVSCASCHSGSDPTVAFVAGGDPMAQRETLMTFDPQVVNLEAPQSSRLLTKGPHSGPSLLASQASDLLEWIAAEREAANVTGGLNTGLETLPFTPLLCTPPAAPGDVACPWNYLDLTGLVEGWGGAQIRFIAQALSQDLYVTNLALIGGPQGVYLEHPLFVSRPVGALKKPDGLDRFFNVKINLMAGGEPQQIGGGTAAFIDFLPTDPISIHFKVVEAYRAEETGGGGGGGGQTGCRQLASFRTNAAGPLSTSCGGCHAAANNVNARGAMDITGINSTDDAVLQNACNQARTRINFQDTNNSGFYLAPNPSVQTNHPFKFGNNQANFDAFKAAVDIWVQAERTSL
jgi:hypothetical protein